MKKYLLIALAMVGMTQAERHMNGFDEHHGDHLLHESRVDPIDVGHHRTFPDYVGHEDRVDGHRSSEHHDPIHSKILPQDILEHPLGGAKYESVHDAVKQDKGVFHGHGGWHGHEDHGHDEHGHDGHHGDHDGHGDHEDFHGHGHDDEHEGHDLHSNDFFDSVHGMHGHEGWHGGDDHHGGWHGDDDHHGHDDNHGHEHGHDDRELFDHRDVHDNPHAEYHH